MKFTKTLILAYILPFIVAVNGCQNSSKQDQPKTQNTVMEEPPPVTDNEKLSTGITSDLKTQSDGSFQTINYQLQTENYNTQDKRMIIRSGSMNIEADNYNETEIKVKQIVTGFNGYVTNSSSVVNANGKKQGALTIRVAADKFDVLRDELAKTGKVMNENITGRDVTEEYMDSEARLKTQRELESRLLRLLEEKTANL